MVYPLPQISFILHSNPKTLMWRGRA
jgi:hypothetical protein